LHEVGIKSVGVKDCVDYRLGKRVDTGDEGLCYRTEKREPSMKLVWTPRSLVRLQEVDTIA
jgi:hypothetical protein